MQPWLRAFGARRTVAVHLRHARADWREHPERHLPPAMHAFACAHMHPPTRHAPIHTRTHALTLRVHATAIMRARRRGTLCTGSLGWCRWASAPFDAVMACVREALGPSAAAAQLFVAADSAQLVDAVRTHFGGAFEARLANHACTHAHKHAHTFMHARMYTHARARTHAYVCTHTHACIHPSMHARAHTYTRTRKHRRTHAHTHTHTHTHARTRFARAHVPNSTDP